MICTYCKVDNPIDCVYCPNCGKPMPVDAPSTTRELSSTGAEPKSEVKVEIFADAPPLVKADFAPDPASAQAPASEIAAVDTVPNQMPAPQNALLTQANLFRLRKNWAQATEQCIIVLKDAPADHAAHSLLGDICRDQGKLEEAVRWYRMALDLRPNPFDQSNLQKLEQQIAKQNLKDNQKSSSSARPVDPIYAGQPAGTGSLAGVSPQRWLKGVTVASLGFLCLFVVYIQFAPVKPGDAVPKPGSSQPQLLDYRLGGSSLPPAKLGGAATLPSGESSSRTAMSQHIAGTGLAPDKGAAQQPDAPLQGANVPVGDLSPAPVKSVSPLGPTGRVGEMSPAPAVGVGKANNLTANMQLSRVEIVKGSAVLYMTAPHTSEPAALRDALVRNAFRAAKTVLENDTTLMRATVIVESGTGDGSMLMAADLDRNSALTSDPDRDSVDELSSRMKMH